MSIIRPVPALDRRVALGSTIVPSVEEVIAALRPEEPVHCVRTAAIAQAARAFTGSFPGTTLYAVKCNPEPAVLRALWDGGVRHFDCASLAEVALVRELFAGAGIHFMHPVKARGAIRDAWAVHGVRDFVLDSAAELDKILAELEATGVEGRPGLLVRLALPKTGAAIDLSAKFGATMDEAVDLLRAAQPHAARVGLTFHVGSQCLDPLAWREAIAIAGRVIHAAGVRVDILDIGGGFPVAYPQVDPLPLGAFVAEIEAATEALGLPNLRLWAEPGRALVAGGGSVVVQVQARRGNALYLNDGVYGALADAGALGFRFPVRLIRRGARLPSGAHEGFRFYGPTCDGGDAMQGPFYLPEDVQEGDFIEIGQLGAYGACLRTGFNGFGRARLAEVRDAPMLRTAGYDIAPVPALSVMA